LLRVVTLRLDHVFCFVADPAEAVARIEAGAGSSTPASAIAARAPGTGG